jgi:Transcription factor homologous to NACalpha-BTF3
MSQITDEDVNILMAQTNIDKKTAREVLIINNGDLVDSIYKLESGEINVKDLEKFRESTLKKEEEETLDFDVDTSNPENLVKYREIIDSKDVIYNRKKEEKKKLEELAKEKEEKRARGEKVEDDEKPEFSIEDLYNIKRGNNTFNSIRVL